jgi:EAL domain-containing protein (putative c-di-GMP-specific phosphodiesterase class I)
MRWAPAIDEASSRHATPAAGQRGDSLASILARDATRAVFQPIVELDTAAVVGVEALARGPAGSPLARPGALFDAARAGDLVAELDWTCRATAFGAALDGGLGQDSTLFVNVEPDALDAPCPARHRQIYESARARLRVVAEITERALAARPAELMAAVAGAREQGFGIALDDIGADRRSLALMPLLRPDVLKLDLRLVQQRPTREGAEIVHAVAAQAERTGAAVLAEGIESAEHVVTARSLGATLGQGWHFGRPSPLQEAVAGSDPGGALPLAPSPRPSGRTPFEIVASAKGARNGTGELLLATSRELEQQAEALGETAIVLARFQDASRVDRDTWRLYERLADRLAFVGVLGAGVDGASASSVRGAEPAPGDSAEGEWDLTVLDPHFAATLAAREAGYRGDGARRFDYAITHDRELAIECARSLMARIAPSGSLN